MQIEIKGNQIFAPLKNKWIPLTPEEKLKQEFICRLVNSYGYRLSQLGQDIQIKKRYKADIAIWKTEKEKTNQTIPTIIITVECKAEHIKIKESDYALGYNFASNINANFFIAHNLKETKIFHVKKDNSPKQLEKLTDIPQAEILISEKQIDKYVKETKIFSRDEFSKLLFKCHNIIRNNDKLSPEASFDEISKILFMKIMYERNSKEGMVFLKDKFVADEINYEHTLRQNLREKGIDQDYMQYLFDNTKRAFENDDIFEKNDQIKIKRNSFEMIVEELEAFNLSDTSDDVKGIAFEQFLGRTFRGELGQFFTPRTVVDFMVEVLDPQEGETICDPCCGSGGFLITAFEHIRDKIDSDIKNARQNLRDGLKAESEENINTILKLLNREFDINYSASRYHKLSHNYIFGTDANARMARTAKMNMIMHGDGHGGVHHNDGLINVNGIFEERFDVILTNPPFGSRVERSTLITDTDLPDAKKIKYYASKYEKFDYEQSVVSPLKEWVNYVDPKTNKKGKPIIDLFELGAYSGLTEVLFLERCLNLLKPGGRMGIVLPEGVLNNTNLQKIRDYVESRAKIILITSIPSDVFVASGATVKPSLLFFKKFTKDEKSIWNDLNKTVKKQVQDKYKPQIAEIQNKIKADSNKLTPAEIKQEKSLIKSLEELMVNEIKSLVKTRFDYEIPIAEVEKAGISSIGSKIENELEPLAEEFRQYRQKKQLWTESKVSINYRVEKGNLARDINGSIEYLRLTDTI